jgi:DNA-binding GntR family transcriptional regulator
MKSDSVFKRAYNGALDIVSKLRGAPLPSENSLSTQLGVSRTTVRKVISALVDRGIVESNGRRIVRSDWGDVERFPEEETVSMAAQVEERFMEWMLRDNARPGTFINELELARRFGVATTGIREFLNRFQRFGLIERRPNARWVFKGFTTEFALDLFEIREMFELRSAKAFAAMPENSPFWAQLDAIRGEHLELLEEIDTRFHDFSDLDSRFHRLINSALPNRFIDDFYDVITVVFHYKHDERERNEVAIREHLAYIEALFDHKASIVEIVCRAHLTSAKETLLRSTAGASEGSRDQTAGVGGGARRLAG